MKKKVALLMVVVILALAGCGSSTSTTEESSTDVATTEEGTEENVTIEWWTPNWDEAVSTELAAEFEAANPGITVELVITDWDTYKSKITTAISASGAPDVCTVLLTDIEPFASKGLLADISAIETSNEIDFDDLLDSALAITTYEDTIYGIPFRYDGSGVYYNVDMLSEAGYDSFPETWDEVNEMNEVLSENGVTAMAWPFGNQSNAVTRYVQALYTYGGNILNDDETEVLLNEQAAIDALTLLCDTLENDYASTSSLEYDNTKLTDAFANENIAWYIGGPFDVASLDESYPDLNYATAVIPGIDGMGTTTANGWCVMIPEYSENKEAAAKLVAYISTPENQARLTASFPASEEALTYEEFSSDKLTPFAEQLDNSLAEPSYDRFAEMEPIIYTYVQAALSGTMSVEDACEGMTADLTSLLGL